MVEVEDGSERYLLTAHKYGVDVTQVSDATGHFLNQLVMSHRVAREIATLLLKLLDEQEKTCTETK